MQVGLRSRASGGCQWEVKAYTETRKCRQRDSNPHDHSWRKELVVTRLTVGCVYQFRHVGVKRASEGDSSKSVEPSEVFDYITASSTTSSASVR